MEACSVQGSSQSKIIQSLSCLYYVVVISNNYNKNLKHLLILNTVTVIHYTALYYNAIEFSHLICVIIVMETFPARKR